MVSYDDNDDDDDDDDDDSDDDDDDDSDDDDNDCDDDDDDDDDAESLYILHIPILLFFFPSLSIPFSSAFLPTLPVNQGTVGRLLLYIYNIIYNLPRQFRRASER